MAEPLIGTPQGEGILKAMNEVSDSAPGENRVPLRCICIACEEV